MLITIDSDRLIEALRLAIKDHAAGAQTVREIAERAVNDVMEQEIELAKEQTEAGDDLAKQVADPSRPTDTATGVQRASRLRRSIGGSMTRRDDA